MKFDAHAKLTLSLKVTGRTVEGLHTLEAEMTTVDLTDDVEVTRGNSLTIDTSKLSWSMPISDVDNTVVRALDVVRKKAAVRIRKRIPAGAGLGGGSADAAAILRWAGETSAAKAAAIGSDVPFCVIGGRARVTGAGEVVEPLPFVAAEYTVLIPPVPVSTADVYARWDEIGDGGISGANDLEAAAVATEPTLDHWRYLLGEETGETPILAGSGSSWFVPGCFPDAHVPGAELHCVNATPPYSRE